MEEHTCEAKLSHINRNVVRNLIIWVNKGVVHCAHVLPPLMRVEGLRVLAPG